MKHERPEWEVAKELGVDTLANDPGEARLILAEKINEMLQSEFNSLVTILYRMDVSESKLKQELQENPGKDAGLLIADLMIERQAQKLKTREQFSQRDNNIDEREKW